LAIFSWESLYTIQVGGLGVAVTMLAEELARQGHEVSYFTRGAPGQPQYMHINGVDYHALQVDPSPSSYSFSLDMSGTMVESLHAVERHSGRFDLIHGHDWLVVDALQRLKAEGRSVVMTYHSTEFGRNGGRFGEWAASKNISDRERYAGEIANQVTTVSHHMLDELGSLSWTRVDTSLTSPRPRRRRGTGSPPVHPWCSSLGGWSIRKVPTYWWRQSPGFSRRGPMRCSSSLEGGV
jgi:hypothetical protein